MNEVSGEFLGGRVQVWHREEGWGVIDLDNVPGLCFVHFSNLPGPGFRELHSDDRVRLAVEAVDDGDQDDCKYRAIGTVRRLKP